MTRARNSANLASHGNLFVDITNDRTGIGSVVPDQNLHVAGTAGFHDDVTFTGDLYNTTWDRSANTLQLKNNAILKLGQGSYATTFVNNINTTIEHSPISALFVKTCDFQISGSGNRSGSVYDNAIFRARTGIVELGFEPAGGSSSFKLGTTAYGVNVTGTTDTDGLIVSGVATVTTMNVTGVLTYDDVTSVDSIGIVTARQGVRVPNGSATSNYISVGNNGALRIWGTTHQFTDIRSGNLHFRNNSLENILELQQDKDIFLYGPSYFSDTARFDSTVTIADTITHHGDTDTKIRFPEADKISFETAGTERFKIHNTTSNVSTHVSIGSSSASNQDKYYLAIKGYERSSQGASGDTVNIGIINQSQDSSATANIDFRLGQAVVSNTAAVRLLAGKGGGWTNTASTRDGYFAISIANNAQVEEKLRITNSGRVGIGTDVPLSGTHLSDGTAYGSPQNSSRKATLTISAGSESSADIQLLNANHNHIFFGDSADPNTGVIYYSHTGGNTDSMNFTTAGSQRLSITSTGTVLHGSGAIATQKASNGGFDISCNSNSLVIGADSGGGSIVQTRTNSTSKDGRIGHVHYTNAEEPIGIVRVSSTSSENVVYFGGGSSLLNAATNLRFYTAGNNTTTSGTERLRIDSTGRLIVGATAASNNSIAEFHRDIGGGAEGCHILVKNTSTNSVNNTARLKLETSGGTAQFYAFATGITELRSRVGGTADWKIRADGAANTRFFTNGEERLRIDSSGRLLLGLTSASNTTTMVLQGNSSTGATGQAILNMNIGTTSISDGTSIGVIRFGATGDRRGADIKAEGAGTWSAGSSHPIDLIFATNPSGSASTPPERLRITSSGMVEMRSNMSASDQANRNIFRFTDTDTSTTTDQSMGRLQWFSSDGSGGGACVKAEIEAVADDTTPEARLRFKTHTGSGTTPTTRMEIHNNGDVSVSTVGAKIYTNNSGGNLTIQGGATYPGSAIKFNGGANGGTGVMHLYAGNGTSLEERLRITAGGVVNIGTNFHLNKVGGQAVTGQDFDPVFKIYNNTASRWLMHLRNDHSTAPNGIFMRAGNASTNYSMYVTGGDEHKPHIVARGDSRVGIGTSNPRTTLHVEGSINGGTINTPFQRFFDKTNNHQRASKHYFRCIKGSGPGNSAVFDIVTVDLNSNFHQAICKVFYGTRLQNISDSTTQVNEIIFGINRFVGNNPTRNRQVIYQNSTTASHADIDVVIMSSTQYRVRLTFSSSCNGSSFAGGYVELIGVGSGSDGAFYSLAHSHGINV